MEIHILTEIFSYTIDIFTFLLQYPAIVGQILVFIQFLRAKKQVFQGRPATDRSPCHFIPGLFSARRMYISSPQLAIRRSGSMVHRRKCHVSLVFWAVSAPHYILSESILFWFQDTCTSYFQAGYSHCRYYPISGIRYSLILLFHPPPVSPADSNQIWSSVQTHPIPPTQTASVHSPPVLRACLASCCRHRAPEGSPLPVLPV